MICYLIRHGKDDSTVRGGWNRHPLTEAGAAQAAALADFFGSHDFGIRHIYSSDLLRAMQTAVPVAERLGLPVMPMPAFREVNNGDLAGRLYPGLYWNTLNWDQRYPGGESPRDFYERIRVAWELFQEKIAARGENVLLVTHGGVINVILTLVNGEAYSNKTPPRKIRNAEWIPLEYRDGVWNEQHLFR